MARLVWIKLNRSEWHLKLGTIDIDTLASKQVSSGQYKSIQVWDNNKFYFKYDCYLPNRLIEMSMSDVFGMLFVYVCVCVQSHFSHGPELMNIKSANRLIAGSYHLMTRLRADAFYT